MQASSVSAFLPPLGTLEANPGLSKTWIVCTDGLILGLHLGLPLSYCNFSCSISVSISVFALASLQARPVEIGGIIWFHFFSYEVAFNVSYQSSQHGLF